MKRILLALAILVGAAGVGAVEAKPAAANVSSATYCYAGNGTYNSKVWESNSGRYLSIGHTIFYGYFWWGTAPGPTTWVGWHYITYNTAYHPYLAQSFTWNKLTGYVLKNQVSYSYIGNCPYGY